MVKKATKDKSNISIIIDTKETYKYKRRRKKYKRIYEMFLHRNNNTLVFCAYYGYWSKDNFHRIFLRTNYDCEILKESMYHYYENHINILLGQIKIVKVSPKLLEDGYAPIDEDGNTLPSWTWNEDFLVTEIYDTEDGDDFDMQVTTKNGEEFVVCSEHFKRSFPVNFFME